MPRDLSSCKLGITAQITDVHGWGIHMLHLCRQLLKRDILPVPLFYPPMLHLPHAEMLELQPVFEAYTSVRPRLSLTFACPFPVLHAGGNQPANVRKQSNTLIGPQDVSCMVFEDEGFDEDDLSYLREFKSIMCVSSWNAKVLSGLGLPTEYEPLGVDFDTFKPPAQPRPADGKFVIFSGGKAELRKGQDIVLAAFKQFHAKHPDSMLVTAWHNLWPETALSLEQSSHHTGSPSVGPDQTLGLRRWASDYGIPAAAFRDVGLVSNRAMAEVLQKVDVALFPNRCEGGTNMMAMECLAAGVPTILSQNSGHLDLIRDFSCWPLTDQKPVTYSVSGWRSLGAWRESSVEQILSVLEDIYRRRDEAQAVAHANHDAARTTWSWAARMNSQIDVIADAAGWR